MKPSSVTSSAMIAVIFARLLTLKVLIEAELENYQLAMPVDGQL